MFQSGTTGELTLPWLGPRLRRKLGELIRRGRMQFYDDLRDEERWSAARRSRRT